MNYDELQQEVYSLRNRLNLSEAVKQEADDIIETLEYNVKKANDELSEVKKQHAFVTNHLKTELKSLEETVQQQLQTILSYEKEVKPKLQDLNINTIVSDTHIECQKEIDKWRNQAELLESSINDLQKQNKKLLETNLQNLEEKDLLSVQLNEVQEILKCKVEELATCKEAMDSLYVSNAEMKAELETQKGGQNLLGSKGNSLFAEVADNSQLLKDKYANIKEQYAKLKKQYSVHHSEICQLRAINSSLQQQLVIAKDKCYEEDKILINAYLDQIKHLEETIDSLKKQKPAYEFKGSTVACLKVFDSLLKTKTEEIEKLREKNGETIMRYVQTSDALITMKRQFSMLEAEKMRADAEVAKLQKEIEKKSFGNSLSPRSTDNPSSDMLPQKENVIKKKCHFSEDTKVPSNPKPVSKPKVKEYVYLKVGAQK